MTFLDIALRNAARGLRVFPVRAGTKEPHIREFPDLATTDTEQIAQWAQKWPDANCGVIGDDTFLIVDTDRWSKMQELFASQLQADPALFDTYCISAREDRRQFTFLQTERSRSMQKRNLDYAVPGEPDNVFEFKSRRKLGMGEGSAHKTGKPYLILQDLPFRPAPDLLISRAEELYDSLNQHSPDGNAQLPLDHGSRHNALVQVAGSLRRAGLSPSAIEVALLQHCSDNLTNDTEFNVEDECRSIAASATWPIPEPEGKAFIGSSQPKPVKDWREHYHSLTDHDSVGPPSFLIEDFLPEQAIMGIGAFVGQKKTLAALNIVFSLCSGEPLFGKYKVTRKPERVLYLGPENGLISFSDRVNRIGLRDYLCKTFFYSTMSMQEKRPLTALMPEELQDAAIVIDTAIRFTDGSENDAAMMKEFAEQAFSLIRSKAACVVMLHHSPKSMTKANELTLENSFRGTGELSAFLSVALAMRTQDMENEYESASLMRFVKQRDFEPKPPSFEVNTSRETCRMTFVDGSDGATIALGNTANKDGKDDAAVALMKANPKLSGVKMSKLLDDAGIDRSKEWVRLKRLELGIGGVKVGSAL